MTAFFNKKTNALKGVSKNKAKKAPKETTTVVASIVSNSDTREKIGGLDLAMVLIRPHVTEKATDLSLRGVYAFEINKRANKMHVRQAVEKLYKVQPTKVAIVNGKPKLMKNPRTGRVQTKKTGTKKALVYLKKGDKIEFA